MADDEYWAVKRVLEQLTKSMLSDTDWHVLGIFTVGLGDLTVRLEYNNGNPYFDVSFNGLDRIYTPPSAEIANATIKAHQSIHTRAHSSFDESLLRHLTK